MTKKEVEVDVELFDFDLNADDDSENYSPWMDEIGITMGDIGDLHASRKQKSTKAIRSLRARR